MFDGDVRKCHVRSSSVAHRTAINTKNSRLVEFKAAQITSPRSVELRGRPGESVGGFTLGVIQLEYIETNHARYRGATAADGSILQVRDRPPARPSQLCRDTGELVKPVSAGVRIEGLEHMSVNVHNQVHNGVPNADVLRRVFDFDFAGMQRTGEYSGTLRPSRG